MPTYQYYCTDNHRTLEVLHPMSQTLRTWGEACALAEVDPGTTPAQAPVEKLLGAGMVLAPRAAAVPTGGPPMGGGCCGGGCGCG